MSVTLEEVQTLLEAQEEQFDLALQVQRGTVDELYLIVSGIAILGLQTGFAMLETGTARSKNSKAILFKNLCDFCFGAWAWYLVGYGIYLGDNKFISGNPTTNFALQTTDTYAPAVQQFGFALTGTTIMSGAVLSRMKFEWYILFATLFTAFIYPIGAHWAWAENGWVGALGYIDFAGSGVVHMVGGIYGLVGAYICGPRVGRFVQVGFDTKKAPRPLPGHSSTLQVLGVFLLTMGWFYFNAGSSGGTGPAEIRSASRALLNSLLSLSVSATVVVIVLYIRDRTHHLAETGNGVLAGLVAVTAPCGYVDPWAACIIGGVAAFVYLGTSHVVLHRFHIDDPVDAFAVHGTSGLWGVLATGLFALEEFGGLFYTGSFQLLFDQIVGGAVLAAWAFATAIAMMYPVHKVFEISLDPDDQLLGMDIKYHEGYAYPEFSANDVVEYNRTRDAATRKMRNRGSESWQNVSESSIHSLGNDVSYRTTSSVSIRGSEKKGRANSEAGSESEEEEDDGKFYV